MDLARLELLPPLLIQDAQREARRQALARQAAPPQGWRGRGVTSRLGAAMIRAGCSIQTAGQRLAAPAAPVALAPCGCGA